MSALMIFVIFLTSALAGAIVFAVAKSCLKKQEISANRHLAACITLAAAAFILVFAVFFSVYFYQYLTPKYPKVKDRTYNLMLFIVPCVLAFVLFLTSFNKLQKPPKDFFNTKNLVRMSVFTALSIVLYLWVKFPLPFIFPDFLDIQISDMPALLAGFTMGTGAGSIIIILKTLIKLPFTSTGGVGELADLILGLVYVVSSSTIYKFIRSKKGAAVALAVGSALTMISAVLINRIILIPFYTTYIFPWIALLNMVKPLYPGVTKENFYNYYLWLAVLPFNALRCLITSLVTFFMYKPTKRIFGKSLR